MALISRVFGTVTTPLSRIGSPQRPPPAADAAIFVVFLLCTLVGRPVQARSHSYDNNSVPPVGSKLEQDVVNAIKVRAHNLKANDSFDPAQLIASPDRLLNDNGDRTTRSSDPWHIFTNVSSKNFGQTTTSRTNGGPSRSFFSNGNSSTHDFKKIIIFPHKKGFQTNDGIEVRNQKPLTDRGAIKEISPQASEKVKEKDDKDKKVKEEAQEDADTKSRQEERKEKKGETPSTEVKEISPTTVIPDDAEVKDEDDKKVESKSKEPVKTKGESPAADEQTKFEQKKHPSDDGEADKDKIKSERKQDDDLPEAETTEEKAGVKEGDGVEVEKDHPEVGKKEIDKDDAGKGKEDVSAIEKEMETSEGDEKEKSVEGKEEEFRSTEKEKKEKPTEGEEHAKGKKKDKAKLEETEGSEEKSEDTLETYSQFTQRVSAEKKNDATNGHGSNGHSKGSKVKGKNYASPDCGAKLVQANPEASHSSKVIHPNKDEYMLNKCRDKIWFVIELCESIRPQKFDIANFELFSNLPKDIQVHGSHRYPSRDWTSFGWFVGQEGNRGLQSFRLDTEDFFKYIKVEVTSNYGSEFYCPISTFQIYGLSEFEVIDTIEDPAEDPDDDSESYADSVDETTKKKSKEEGKQSVIPAVLKNMFSGVLDVIKRGYRPSSSDSELEEDCYSLPPKFAVQDDLCPMARSINYILSCYKMEYEALMQQPFVSSTVKNSSFCRQLALTMCAEPEVNDSVVYDTVCNNSYVCVMLSPKHVLAMCFMQDPHFLEKTISCESDGSTLSENFSSTSDILPTIEAPTYVENADINTSSITRSDAIDANLSESLDLTMKIGKEGIKDGKSATEQMLEKDSASAHISESSAAETVKSSPKETKTNGNGAKEKVSKEGEQEVKAQTAEPEEKIEQEGSGYGGIEDTEEEIATPTPSPSPPAEEIAPSSSSTPPSATLQQAEPKVSNSPTNKESVVVRLSNKIKALEYNMSISSQYLEELSRRYKRQMEEMQRQFNLTIAALNDTSWQAYERDQNHQRDISKLEEQLANVSGILMKLVEERETLAHTVVEQHVLLMVVEVIVLCMVFTICSRRRNDYRNGADYGHTRRNQTPSEDPSGSSLDQDASCLHPEVQGRARVRRRSVDSITSERNSRLRQRRPSEEALNITGTYQDLLIIEPAIPILMDSVSDRKKKRKSTGGSLKRSKSNASITDKATTSRRAKRLEKLKVSSAGVLFCGDEVDSKKFEHSPDVSVAYSPNSLDAYGLMHEPHTAHNSHMFSEYPDISPNMHCRSALEEIRYTGAAHNNFDSVSKRHSLACISCDNVQKREKLPKSLSLGSAPEQFNTLQEKVKKTKKSKKARVKDPSPMYADTSPLQSTYPSFNKDYYYPKPNGISYCSSLDSFDNYYYNGHNGVHFSDDTSEHCDHTYSRSEDIPINGGSSYSNGIHTSDYGHLNEYSHTNHDTQQNLTEKKKLSPKVKSKVKLRSDNWEWYSSQHLGSSSSETISTCSDSSGKSRKVKQEDQLTENDRNEEKKSRRKKKTKSKSSPAMVEEETVLEVEAGT